MRHKSVHLDEAAGEVQHLADEAEGVEEQREAVEDEDNGAALFGAAQEDHDHQNGDGGAELRSVVDGDLDAVLQQGIDCRNAYWERRAIAAMEGDDLRSRIGLGCHGGEVGQDALWLKAKQLSKKASRLSLENQSSKVKTTRR